MTTLIAAVVSSRHLIMTGWTLGLILWETAALAVVLAAWRLVHPRASAQQQYTAAVLALGAAVVLAAVTPFALTVVAPWESARQAPITTAPRAAGLRVPQRRNGEARFVPSEPQGVKAFSADALAGAGAAIWAAGVLILGVRLLGGAILASSIRKRARPIGNESAREVVERLHADAGLPVRVTLLQSEHVEAPVVVGWRRPALILPTDVTDQLTPDMIGAVLAHEFAHIERRDYVANVLQSIVETLLFFSPAVAWISRRIREAREYCCDDAAVHRCGDPKHYVQALTMLASLATVNTVRPALGAAGPRLIVRARRLLREETMPRFSSLRLLALAATLVILLVTGLRVGAASAAYASRFGAHAATAGAPALQTRIPFGYATEQDGSGIVLGPVAWTQDAPVPRATVRNTTSETITGLRFVAVVERIPSRTPVRLFTSELMPVSVAQGQSAEILPEVFSPEQLQEVAVASRDRVQVFVGLQAVVFANGSEWHITPNPTATNARDALMIQPSEIPRSLLEAAAGTSPTRDPICRDQNGRKYSPGAIVKLRNEPGRFARCNNGRWEESAGR